MNFVTGRETPAPSPVGAAHRRIALHWGVAVALGLALVWSYWPTLLGMAERWRTNPHYSHGFLVPCFAALVLWFRRDMLTGRADPPCLPGALLLAAGLGLRLVAAQMDIESVDAFSLLPTLAGAVLFVGGRGLFAWCWPGIAFLAFMLPLPYTIEMALAQPLRRLATVASTYLLQTLGYPALSEGTVIVIDQLRMGVVDACSGLGMLMTFFALATALVMVVDAPRSDRIVLVLSAIPIALVANIARITATGAAYHATGDEAVQTLVHEAAGWLMMPLALGLFWLELRFLERLLPPRAAAADRPLPLWGATPVGATPVVHELPSSPPRA